MCVDNLVEEREKLQTESGLTKLFTGVDNLRIDTGLEWGMEQVWGQVLVVVEDTVGKTTTETWLKPIRPIALRDDTLHLEVPSSLFRDWLLGNLIKPLNESLAATLGYPAQVSIHVGDKPQGELFAADDAEVEKEVEKAAL